MVKAPAAFAEVFLAMSRELPLDSRAKQQADGLLTLVDAAFWGGGLGKVEVDPRKVNVGTNKCGTCGEPGHNARTCEKPKKRQYTCRNCGEKGHNSATCENPTVPKPPKGKRGMPKKSIEQYRADIEAKYPGMLEMLGDATDRVIGKEYGLSRQRIHQIRKRLGKEHDG